MLVGKNDCWEEYTSASSYSGKLGKYMLLCVLFSLSKTGCRVLGYLRPSTRPKVLFHKRIDSSVIAFCLLFKLQAIKTLRRDRTWLSILGRVLILSEIADQRILTCMLDLVYLVKTMEHEPYSIVNICGIISICKKLLAILNPGSDSFLYLLEKFSAERGRA